MIRFKSVKRSVSLLLALSMSLCLAAAPVQAEPGLDAAATAYYVKQLRDLGVLDYEVTAQMYDQPVTRAQTYGAALGLLGELTDGLSFAEYAFSDIAELPEANRIQFAYEQGCLESAWKFEPEAGSTVGEALRLIVSEMGYQEIARELGDGGAGFVTMANRLGILKGLSVSRNDALTWETLVTLLHNSLDIEILHLIGYSADGLILGEVTGCYQLFCCSCFLVFGKFFSTGFFVSHHNTCQCTGSGYFNWRSGNNVTVLNAGSQKCTGDHRTCYKCQVCDFYLNSAAVCRLNIRTAICSCTNLGFGRDPFHIFSFVCVRDFDRVYLIGGSTEVFVHRSFLLVG